MGMKVENVHSKASPMDAGLQRRYEFRSIRAGVETLASGSRPRHHHDEGYALVVLAGSVVEASFSGRMFAEPGDVLLHGRFDCHADWTAARTHLQVLRLPWRDDALEGQFRVADPDALARLAERDAELAAKQLSLGLLPGRPRDTYWVDELALALSAEPPFLLRDWGHRRGLRPDVVSSVFSREFGVSPKRFRLESRTRQAWRRVMASPRPLTDIAFEAGFSDLAHMSRNIRLFTGGAPTCWRQDR